MIYQQSVFEPWPIESESVQAVITSPPYYALRKYDIPDVIIGGDKDCKHEFDIEQFKTKNQVDYSNSGLKNDGRLEINRVTTNRNSKFNEQENLYKSGICIYCNAWQGQYGLEPTPQMYVEHTLLWAKEAWRVLRNDGVFFLNIADSYAGSGGASGDYNSGGLREGQPKYKQCKSNYHSKCQLLIPHRVAIALVDAGWTLRNTVVWHKTNAMPESVTDRFSKKYEYIFMFTKQEKYYFDLDAIREKCSSVNRLRDRNSELSNNGYVGDSFSKGKRPEQHPLGKNPGDLWSIPTQPSSEKHYAMWPERLVERMVKCSTKAGDIVLDPFCGSGSTLKVAEQLNRKGIGIDLGYHEISNRRTCKIQKEMFV